MNPFCRRCKTEMVIGVAIPPAITDDGESHYDGVAPRVSVWKCQKCGHSFRGSPMTDQETDDLCLLAVIRSTCNGSIWGWPDYEPTKHAALKRLETAGYLTSRTVPDIDGVVIFETTDKEVPE